MCSCSCSSIIDTLPSFTIQLGEYSYILPPDSFTSETGNIINKQCYIDIYALSDDYANSDGITLILGNTFMRQFTGSFNLESGNISLTPSVTSDDGISV